MHAVMKDDWVSTYIGFFFAAHILGQWNGPAHMEWTSTYWETHP